MKFLLILLSFLLSISCSEFGDDRVDNTPTNPDNEQEDGGDNSGNNTQNPPTEWGNENSYVFDITSVPEVRRPYRSPSGTVYLPSMTATTTPRSTSTAMSR